MGQHILVLTSGVVISLAASAFQGSQTHHVTPQFGPFSEARCYQVGTRLKAHGGRSGILYFVPIIPVASPVLDSRALGDPTQQDCIVPSVLLSE